MMFEIGGGTLKRNVSFYRGERVVLFFTNISFCGLYIDGFDILIRSKELSGTETYINGEIRKTYNSMGANLKPKDVVKDNDQIESARKLMCSKYFDIRTFGAVLSTGPNAGQVRGAVQMTFARSVDPVFPLEHAITVCAARDENKPYDSQIGIQGRKYTIPYGLYVCHGFISANLAQQTGFSQEDLDLFFDALKNMFDVDRSAARGLMSAQRLIVFKHNSVLGNAPANKLFDLVKVECKDKSAPARSFADYEVTIDSEHLPAGVTIEELI